MPIAILTTMNIETTYLTLSNTYWNHTMTTTVTKWMTIVFRQNLTTVAIAIHSFGTRIPAAQKYLTTLI